MACCRANSRLLSSVCRSVPKDSRTCTSVFHSWRSFPFGLPLASTTRTLQQRLSLSHHSYPFIHTEEAAKTFVIQLDERSRSYLLGELQRVTKDQGLLAGETSNSPASAKQLLQVFIFNGVPFIGFGLLDNLIMIVAGEYIDQTLGVTLGISTMAAAGLGNLISDIAGIGTAGWVEVMAGRIGVKTPDLSPEQAKSKSVHWVIGLGRVVGISIGCLVGMFPLLFFKKRVDEDEENILKSPSKDLERPDKSTST